MTKIKEMYNHICEVCGKEELLTLEEGFNQGWDWPPHFGAWGVLSPRTCGDCGIQDTVWWAAINNASDFKPDERQMVVINRILAETGIPDVIEEIE